MERWSTRDTEDDSWQQKEGTIITPTNNTTLTENDILPQPLLDGDQGKKSIINYLKGVDSHATGPMSVINKEGKRSEHSRTDGCERKEEEAISKGLPNPSLKGFDSIKATHPPPFETVRLDPTVHNIVPANQLHLVRPWASRFRRAA